MKKTTFVLLAALALSTLPLAALTIESGIDVWRTPADSSTRVDFHSDPIPSGFFCEDSRPFYGTIALGGTPIVTSPEGALVGADTVIRRLDNLVFERGVAQTRIQVAALALESIHPLVTDCGNFAVRVDLYGEQPVTTMRVVDQGRGTGTYSAPLSLNTKMSFVPLDGGGNTLTLLRRVDLDSADNTRWASNVNLGRLAQSHVMVDATGNGRAETLLPGLSGAFVPINETRSVPSKMNLIEDPEWQLYCHAADEGHQHCFWGICFGTPPNLDCLAAS